MLCAGAAEAALSGASGSFSGGNTAPQGTGTAPESGPGDCWSRSPYSAYVTERVLDGRPWCAFFRWGDSEVARQAWPPAGGDVLP